MSRICKEAEAFLDYDTMHKKIQEIVSLPLSPIESLAASAVSTARSLCAAAIVVLTKGGYTVELVAKYRPSVPILSVVVPEITRTDDFEWSCSESAAHVARRGLIYRGIVPVMATGASARSSNKDSTEETIRSAIEFAKKKGICKTGDSIVALHKIDGSSVVKILYVE
ncbi:PREDICTED: pyruvate kinase, cytosolic isozyme-like [Camelina sativa]|uniref:Pyruvate kinase, cytosolic isozyme-like n=1 Tax=Camelina sativa TaxID=90675 RepID=A0ABM0XR59_CAMSA|nr:PREDICTED: pyruvate kinase, cytosolic isozyme-like [Camelina sativa]